MNPLVFIAGYVWARRLALLSVLVVVYAVVGSLVSVVLSAWRTTVSLSRTRIDASTDSISGVLLDAILRLGPTWIIAIDVIGLFVMWHMYMEWKDGNLVLPWGRRERMSIMTGNWVTKNARIDWCNVVHVVGSMLRTLSPTLTAISYILSMVVMGLGGVAVIAVVTFSGILAVTLFNPIFWLAIVAIKVLVFM